MKTVTEIKNQLPNLETKQVWSIFTHSFEDYARQPFTTKGERNWKIFQEAKRELKARGEGWWGN